MSRRRWPILTRSPLRMLGHAPGTDLCTVCGSEVEAAHRLAFALIAGGVVCASCRPRQHKTLSVRREVIDEIRRLQSPETRQLPTQVPPNRYGELRAVLNRYIENMLGQKPRMQSYLPTVTRTEPTA